MPRSKNYKSESPAGTQNQGLLGLSRDLKLNYAEESNGRRNPTSSRNVDLTKWIGLPQERWANAWMQALRYLIHRGDVEIATCVKQANIHSVFFAFLQLPQLAEPPNAPEQLKPRHMTLFRQWLAATFRQNTAHNYYRHVKGMCLAMIELGLIDGYIDEFFPRNVLKKGPSTHAATPLTEPELERLAAALKRDLISLHKGTFEASNLQGVTVYFLVLAMRTGGNPTPLLELSRDGLKPHLLPGMMRIDLVKRRAANTYPAALRGPQVVESVLSVPTDGVAILNRVLETTRPLVDRAHAGIANRVWLFLRDGSDSTVLCLTQGHIDKAFGAFVRRHGLLSDIGEPLRLNTSRLRKNKAQQLFKISGGDLSAVATLLGNTTGVVAQNYMSMTPAIRAEGAQFVGEVLEEIWSGKKFTNPDRPVPQPTPVAQCQDSLNGANAPKDGKTHCDQFLHCLGCPSFAIAGTLADLHRLFSFQGFLKVEIDYFPPESEYDEWRSHRKRLIDLIDDFVVRKFPEKLVNEARIFASSEPHKFWAIQINTLKRIRGLHG